MRTSRFRPRGLTMIEVFVVLFVLALLIMMTLPAIQTARESARQATCKNNLKQLGLAFHNYHETYGSFPMPYMIDGGNPLLNPPREIAGSVVTRVTDEGLPLFKPPFNLNAQAYGPMLIPFVDAGPNRKIVDYNTPCYSADGIANVNVIIARFGRQPHDVATAVANEAGISATVPVFNCPSTPTGPRTEEHGYADLEQKLGVLDPEAPGTKLSVTYASSDYQAINGISLAFAEKYFHGSPQVSLCGILTEPNTCPQIRDVLDGLSNTWMLAERAGSNDVWRGKSRIHEARKGVFFEAQADGTNYNFQTGGGWGDFESGHCWLAGSLKDGTSPDGHGPCLINCTNLNARGLYSFHPGGIHVLCGDGRVQLVSESIDTDLVVQAITRAGLDVLSPGSE